MAFVVIDRARESTTVVGTGPMTLLGATAGCQSFAGIGNGNRTYYTLADAGQTYWEVGIGTYSTTGPTLTRDTVLASSSGGALVNFPAGAKEVFCDYPAARAVYQNVNGTDAVVPFGPTKSPTDVALVALTQALVAA